MTLGRPPIPETLIRDALQALAEGESTLLGACKTLGISYSSVREQIRKSPDLAALYSSAREGFVEARVEGLDRIPYEVADVQRARLISDNTRWIASKVMHKTYGDRTHHDHDVTPDSPLASLLAGMGRSAIPLASPSRVIEHDDQGDDSIPIPSVAQRNSGG